MDCIITEVNKNYAVVLNKNGEFIKIANRNYKIGQKIKHKKVDFAMLSSLAAGFVIFCLLSVAGYSIYYTPQSYIGIDINPSMQLVINCFDRIIAVETFNEDANIVLGKARVDHNNYQEGIEKIINASKELDYLTEANNQVVIDIATVDETLVLNVNSKTKGYQDAGIVINIERANQEEIALSKELGVSLGRTKAISEYTESYGGDVRVNKEKLKGLSVNEIRKENKRQGKKVIAGDVYGDNSNNKYPNNTALPNQTKSENNNGNLANARARNAVRANRSSNAQAQNRGEASNKIEDNVINNQQAIKGTFAQQQANKAKEEQGEQTKTEQAQANKASEEQGGQTKTEQAQANKAKEKQGEQAKTEQVQANKASEGQGERAKTEQAQANKASEGQKEQAETGQQSDSTTNKEQSGQERAKQQGSKGASGGTRAEGAATSSNENKTQEQGTNKQDSGSNTRPSGNGNKGTGRR